MTATVFAVDVKTQRPAAPRFRPAVFTIVCLVMALTALTTAPACAQPGGAGRLGDPTGEVDGEAPLTPTPFDRQGMWVWYIGSSDGGSVPRILARARAAGVGTVYVKSGDGGDYWSQFSGGLLEALHRGGLDVCAWQFVYGARPAAEARVGAAAARRGADCLAIDAESAYEGRYAAADRYVRALRARVGAELPLSLAGFPYVDYHPAFPYSVFFGPEGATANQPQMYWKAIGTSVRGVYEHTYLFNRLWGRPIYPVGQTYEDPGPRQLLGFRRYAASYGGLPPSWWSWQETSARGWGALGAPAEPVRRYQPPDSQPLLKRGSRGDLVVWAQEHLVGAGALPISGYFGPRTYAAVRAFQLSRGLLPTGTIEDSTWSALLQTEPLRPRWSSRRARKRGGAVVSRALPASRPASASLPAKAYEIDPGPAP